MRVLVLSGYGLIGLAVSKRLANERHHIIGLGRSARKGQRVLPQATWLEADISKLLQPQDWQPFLSDIDVVVNASGALQNGLKDNVGAVQRDAIKALIEACGQAGIQKFIQISAPGVSETSDTQFYRTKASADSALKASPLNWTILRPGLVIAPHAYGGTSLIRTLAAFPIVQPIILADTPIQTVSIEDVADAVALAVSGDLAGQDVDLVEPKPHTLSDIVLGFRSWLGFGRPQAVMHLPKFLGLLGAKLADMAGWLGWRSAMRTTALSVLNQGVVGNSSDWERASGRQIKPLELTLASLPSTVQERLYARIMLAFPIALIMLAGFWITSGVVGLVQHDKAVTVLAGALPDRIASAFVIGGSIVDTGIGAALLFRPTMRLACFGSILVSTGYLIGSVIAAPHLWADPLGPMVKVFPAIALALMVAAASEER